jgi:hypothetical protein
MIRSTLKRAFLFETLRTKKQDILRGMFDILLKASRTYRYFVQSKKALFVPYP